MWICKIIGHKFEKFVITEWGLPYNTGHMVRPGYCFRCGSKPNEDE